MLSFQIKCPSVFLSNLFDKAIDNAINDEVFETHGIHLKLKRKGDSFFNMDGDVIFINTIADIEVFKDIGLFSSEIKGVIDINLFIKYDLDSKFKLSTKTEILNYKWVEKPKLEVGILNMPVGKLVELALQHYESIITAKVDTSISQNIDVAGFVHSQINSINDQLKFNAFGGLQTFLELKKVFLERPRYVDGEVLINGGVVVEAIISDHINLEEQVKVNFEWITEMGHSNLVLARYSISDGFIKNMVDSTLTGQNLGGKPLEFQNLVLNTDEKSIRLNASINSPIEGDLVFMGKPKYIEANQTLELVETDFNIKPKGIIYKLSAPLVNKFIEAKINEVFPLDIARLISNSLEKYLPQEVDTSLAVIKPSIQQVKLDSFGLKSNNIHGNISVINPHLNIQFRSGE